MEDDTPLAFMDNRLRPGTVMLSQRIQALRKFESLIFYRSHLSTEETLPTLVLGSLVVALFGVFLGGVCFLFLVCSPLTNMQSFHPSLDDLGTPSTRRPHSWKKNSGKCL